MVLTSHSVLLILVLVTCLDIPLNLPICVPVINCHVLFGHTTHLDIHHIFSNFLLLFISRLIPLLATRDSVGLRIQPMWSYKPNLQALHEVQHKYWPGRHASVTITSPAATPPNQNALPCNSSNFCMCCLHVANSNRLAT